MIRPAAIVFAMVVSACSSPGSDRAIAAPDLAPSTAAIDVEPAREARDAEHAHLRNAARLVLEAHCGQCHIHEYETSVPGALAVFDLSELEWSARMSDLQLTDAAGRVRDRRGPDGPLDIDDAAVARVAAFVDAELARRAAP